MFQVLPNAEYHSRSRRLARHVVHNSVDTLDFVGDPGGDLSEDLWWVDEPVCRHKVFRLNGSESDNLYHTWSVFQSRSNSRISRT